MKKHLKKTGGHISRNIVEITIQLKAIVWKSLMKNIQFKHKVKFFLNVNCHEYYFMIISLPCKNNYWRGLRQWYSTSGKCTCPSRNPATQSGTNRCRHQPPCQCTQDRIYVLNQTGDISTLNGSSLKLVDKFTYLGSSVSSTETDINTWLAKAWTAINRLLVISKSDLTDKMKRFFPSSSHVNTAI